MRVIIAGGRDFYDYEYMKKSLDGYFLNRNNKNDDIEIICGEAKGADSLGKKYALEHNYKVISFPANWKKYGKIAGYIRNTQMRDYAEELVVFWDGKSKGTHHMIKIAQEINMPIAIYWYNKPKY